MLKSILLTITTFYFSNLVVGQSMVLSPKNNPADITTLQSDSSLMEWIMLNDTLEIKIGDIKTRIQKQKELTYIITEINMMQSPMQWVDSTVVKSTTLEPVYHSSYNQQRDMVLRFGTNVEGYYLDKKSDTKTQIKENPTTSFFDSNFYPEYIRMLPFTNGYQDSISIFDYNPKSRTGVMTATIKDTEKVIIQFKNEKKEVWKVVTTDDISDNQTTVIYYFETKSRKKLLQEILFKGRKMLMRLVE